MKLIGQSRRLKGIAIERRNQSRYFYSAGREVDFAECQNTRDILRLKRGESIGRDTASASFMFTRSGAR